MLKNPRKYQLFTGIFVLIALKRFANELNLFHFFVLFYLVLG